MSVISPSSTIAAGPFVFEMSSSTRRHSPAFEYHHAEPTAGPRLSVPVIRFPSRSAHASFAALTERLGGTREQRLVPAIRVDLVQPVVQHDDEAPVARRHDTRRHRRHLHRVQFFVAVVEPVQRVRRAVDEVQTIAFVVPDQALAPSDREVPYSPDLHPRTLRWRDVERSGRHAGVAVDSARCRPGR